MIQLVAFGVQLKMIMDFIDSKEADGPTAQETVSPIRWTALYQRPTRWRVTTTETNFPELNTRKVMTQNLISTRITMKTKMMMTGYEGQGAHTFLACDY